MRALRLASIAVPLIAAVIAVAQGCYKPEFGSPGYYCHPGDDPACPDGQTCVAGRCIGGASGDGGSSTPGMIPKTGSYTGAKVDPMLSDVAACTDSPLEPNDTISSALKGLMVTVDGTPLKLGMLAICPTGNNPKADGHDVDYYEITAPSSISAIVEITYDIKYGDLDVGIFRADGSLVASDGSAVSNGCAAASLPAGTYYIAVAGANNTDVNRYQLTVRFSSTPKSCTQSGAGDMAI